MPGVVDISTLTKSAMTINVKKLKKFRHQKCDWCGYPLEFCGREGDFHSECYQKPDYHDHEKFWDWMYNPERPTGTIEAANEFEHSLTPQDRQDWEDYKTWKEIKNGNVLYD